MKKRPLVVYHHPGAATLAESVCCVLGRLHPQKMQTVKGAQSWNSFPDGWPELFTDPPEEIRGYDAAFFAAFESPADVFEQYAFICALARSGTHSLTVVLPFFPVGTNERVSKCGEIATAMSLWRILSSIPSCDSGEKVRILTYDLHALQEQFYPGDGIAPKLQSAIPLLLKRLDEIERCTGRRYAIAFPDDGARKRFGSMFLGRDIVVCGKVRRGEERIVTIKEGDPAGQHITIVDDLIQTGGTAIEASLVLREQGAASVSLYATHGVFPNNAHTRFTPDLFERVWMTESCPSSANAVAENPTFEILSLAPRVAEYFLRGEIL